MTDAKPDVAPDAGSEAHAGGDRDELGPPTVDEASPSGKRRWSDPATSAVLAVGAVFAVAGVLQLIGTWRAVGDYAVAELIVRHLGRHVPLSGPYSAQRGYNHPLPTLYALLWPAYALSGGRSSSSVATAVWWNGASAALIVWVLARRKAAGLALLAVAALPVLAGRQGRNVFVLPWNPNLGLITLLALVFVCWRVMHGERRLLPLAVALAAWSTGMHLGYLLPAAALGLAACVGLLVSTLRRDGATGLRRLLPAVAAGVAVLALFAAPAVVDLVAHGQTSNPTRILHADNPQGVSVPAREARLVLQAELSIPPAWAVTKVPFSRPFRLGQLQQPWLLLLSAVAVAAALRRHAFDEVTGIGLSLLGVLVSCAQLIHMADRVLQPWYLYPAHATSVALCAFTVWSLARSAGALTRVRPPAALVRVGTPLAFGLASLLLLPSLRTPEHHNQIHRTSAQLVEQVARAVPKGSRVLVSAPVRFDGFYSETIVLVLDKAGYDVRVPDDERWLYTAAMTKASPAWLASAKTLTITLGKDRPTPPEPGDRLVAQEYASSNISPPRWIAIWLSPG